MIPHKGSTKIKLCKVCKRKFNPIKTYQEICPDCSDYKKFCNKHGFNPSVSNKD